MVDVLTFAARATHGIERLPHGHGDPGDGEGRVHQGKRCLRGNQREVPRSVLNLQDRKLLAHQMFTAWKPMLGLVARRRTNAPSRPATRRSTITKAGIRKRAREVLDQLEREDRIGIVMLGRPYHHDPGLNHEILEEFQKLGYPIFSQSTLPLDEDMLERLFGEEVRAGVIKHPLDIADVWKNSYSCSTNHKVWAAKFTARHPNLVAMEISSFKCGHDAPIYGVIEGIIEKSGTPVFLVQGSRREQAVRLDQDPRRDHRLLPAPLPRGHHQEGGAARDVEAKLAEYERKLRQEMTGISAPTEEQRELQLV